MDLLTMSKEELGRLEVMERLQEKRMKQRTAAEILGVSIRQVKRLLRAYRRDGAAGLASKQRGKPGHHQMAPETGRAALDLLKGRYADFGPTLAHEKLVELHGMKLCLGSVRKIMLEEGLWKAKRARKLEVHQMRERRACFGELEQMDGTDHDWFEGRSERCSLLVMIDDASGKLGALCNGSQKLDTKLREKYDCRKESRYGQNTSNLHAGIQSAGGDGIDQRKKESERGEPRI